MKLNRLLLLAGLLSLMPAARAEEESATAIFSNAAKNAAGPVVFPRRTSIIFIACDGLGLGDLSCYGQTNFQTPNLDRLAQEGTRFTDYRAGGDELAPAQATLMAGKSVPSLAGEATVAARLQLTGYHTGLIGEWALGTQPWTQGFDEFCGFLNEQEGRDYYAEAVWRYFPEGVTDTATGTKKYSVHESLHGNEGGSHQRYLPDVLMTAANNFVRVHQPSRANHFRPFFLLVSLPAPRSATDGKDDFPVPTDAPFTDEHWPQAAKNRASLISRLDSGVGQLLEQLKNNGLTNNVAVFLAGAVAPKDFASTNLNFLKLPGEVRRETDPAHLRVPLLVRWPGQIPAGKVAPEAWNAADFAPTALEIGYVKRPAGYTGVSLLNTLSEKKHLLAPKAHATTNTPAGP